MYEKQKVVLTGGSGFIGGHLVELLIHKGYDVHCIVRKTSSLKWLKSKEITFHYCGLENIEALATVFEHSVYIFHLAGTVAALNYEGYYYGNVTLTKNVLEAALLQKNSIKKIVVTSSLAVCGPSIKENPITENDGFNPISLYGKAKMEQEKLCSQFFDRLPISIARPSVITGEREAELFELIKTIDNGLMPLVGFEDKWISIVYIKDLLHGLVDMAIAKNTAGETYNMSSDEILSWRQFGEIVANKLDKKPIFLKLPHTVLKMAGGISGLLGKLRGKAPTFDLEKAKEGVQTGFVCSVNKAKNDFGYKLSIPIKEAIEKSIDWYKQEGWLS